MTIKLAQVVCYYPNFGACEVVMIENGARFQNVPVINHFMTSNSGVRMFHAMMRPASEDVAGGLMDLEETRMPLRSVMAACIMTAGQPMIIGFLPHPLNQMQFAYTEQNRDIYRHPTGNMVNVQKDGNIEVQHTGGAFLKIGKDIDGTDADRVQDLTPVTPNGNWELPINDPVTITICTGDQGENAIKIRVRPNGDTDIMSSGYFHARYQADAHIDVGEAASLHAGSDITLTSAGMIHIRTPSDVTVTAGGTATVQAAGSANVYAGTDATVAAAGSASLTAGSDVTVAAVGSVDIGAEGPITIASGEAILMAAPIVTMSTELLVVTGEIVDGGEIGGILGALEAEIAAADLAADAGALAGTAGLATASEIAAAEADIEEAAESIADAVLEASETSLEAVGLGEADNQGLSGNPASDVPV